MDYELIRNSFAVLGIIWFSSMIVFRVAEFTDKIRLWGWKKGIKKWWASLGD